MSDLNSVNMSGRLTRDIELKYLPSQTAVAEAGIACNRKYKDKDQTCFCEITVMGKQAEVFAKYLKKGDPVIISGRLELDQWEAQDGSKRSKHRIFVENFTFTGSPTSSNNDNFKGERPGPQDEAPSQFDPQGMDDNQFPF